MNHSVKIVNGAPRRIIKIMVHRFTLSDVDDPDLYAAEPLLAWQNSEDGKWVIAHAIETPSWHRITNYESYCIEYKIVASLYEEDAVYFKLKWK